MTDARRSQMPDMQALQPPVTRACEHAMIQNSRSKHATCTNRLCGCFCHSSGGFSKSWKHASADSRSQP